MYCSPNKTIENNQTYRWNGQKQHNSTCTRTLSKHIAEYSGSNPPKNTTNVKKGGQISTF